jgi:hypothetical protein
MSKVIQQQTSLPQFLLTGWFILTLKTQCKLDLLVPVAGSNVGNRLKTGERWGRVVGREGAER